MPPALLQNTAAHSSIAFSIDGEPHRDAGPSRVARRGRSLTLAMAAAVVRKHDMSLYESGNLHVEEVSPIDSAGVGRQCCVCRDPSATLWLSGAAALVERGGSAGREEANAPNDERDEVVHTNTHPGDPSGRALDDRRALIYG